MRIFIQASEYKLWTMITHGPYVPSKLVNNVSIPKPESEWDEYDEWMAQLNTIAMNLLYCVVILCTKCKWIQSNLHFHFYKKNMG